MKKILFFLKEMEEKDQLPDNFLGWFFYTVFTSLIFTFACMIDNEGIIPIKLLTVLIIALLTIPAILDGDMGIKEVIVCVTINTVTILSFMLIGYLILTGKIQLRYHLVWAIVLSIILNTITKLHKKPAD